MKPARSSILAVYALLAAISIANAGDPPDSAVPPLHPSYFERGMAGLMADGLQSKPTASGELYDPAELTAAHPDLDFGTVIRVTNVATDQTVDVRVIERADSEQSRVVELSRAAARRIGMADTIVGEVTLSSTLVRRPSFANRHVEPLRPTAERPLIRLTPVSAEAALRPPPTAPPVSKPSAPEPPKPVVAQQPAAPPKPAPAPAPTPAPAPAPAPAPPQKPAPQSQPEPEPAAAGGYRVQFGAFSSASNARLLQKELQSKGVESMIIKRQGQVLNRVVSQRAFPDPKNAGEWAGALVASRGIAETVVTR